MDFLNALERIPKFVEQYKAQNVTYDRDIPILQETVEVRMEVGGRVEDAESGGRGVGEKDTTYTRSA